MKLHLLVQNLMHENFGNVRDARAALFCEARGNPDVMEALLSLGVDQAIRNYFSAERRAAGEADRAIRKMPEDTDESRARRIAKVERRLFWDRYALFGQMELKTAKRPDLRTSAMARRKQAAGNIACANFEEDLMRRFGSNSSATVSQFFKINKVVELAKVHNVIKS